MGDFRGKRKRNVGIRNATERSVKREGIIKLISDDNVEELLLSFFIVGKQYNNLKDSAIRNKKVANPIRK